MQGTIKYPHPKNKSIKNVWTETMSAIYWTGFVWYLINPEIYPLQIYTDFSESNKTSLSVLFHHCRVSIMVSARDQAEPDLYQADLWGPLLYLKTGPYTVIPCQLFASQISQLFSYDNYRENNTIGNGSRSPDFLLPACRFYSNYDGQPFYYLWYIDTKTEMHCYEWRNKSKMHKKRSFEIVK